MHLPLVWGIFCTDGAKADRTSGSGAYFLGTSTSTAGDLP